MMVCYNGLLAPKPLQYARIGGLELGTAIEAAPACPQR